MRQEMLLADVPGACRPTEKVSLAETIGRQSARAQCTDLAFTESIHDSASDKAKYEAK